MKPREFHLRKHSKAFFSEAKKRAKRASRGASRHFTRRWLLAPRSRRWQLDVFRTSLLLNCAPDRLIAPTGLELAECRLSIFTRAPACICRLRGHSLAELLSAKLRGTSDAVRTSHEPDVCRAKRGRKEGRASSLSSLSRPCVMRSHCGKLLRGACPRPRAGSSERNDPDAQTFATDTRASDGQLASGS